MHPQPFLVALVEVQWQESMFPQQLRTLSLPPPHPPISNLCHLTVLPRDNPT